MVTLPCCSLLLLLQELKSFLSAACVRLLAIKDGQLKLVYDCLSCGNLNPECKELSVYYYFYTFLLKGYILQLLAVTAVLWIHFLLNFLESWFWLLCCICFHCLWGNHNLFGFFCPNHMYNVSCYICLLV